MVNVTVSTTGTQGPQGFGWLSGAGAPAAGTGNDGWFYLDTTNVGYYYGPKTAGAWGTPHPFGNSLNGVPLGNYVATIDPGTSNDSSQGYSVGSIWVNTATSRVFLATAVTVSAAIWSCLKNYAYKTVTGNYTLSATLDQTLYVNAATAPIAITLPSATGIENQFVVKKTDTTTNPITVTGTAGATIDGATSYVIASPYQASTFAPAGGGVNNWYVV